MTLTRMLKELFKLGCYPSIYRRGVLWRAHINAAGNYWSDARSPRQALREAITLWEKAGSPVDGMAAEAKVEPAPRVTTEDVTEKMAELGIDGWPDCNPAAQMAMLEIIEKEVKRRDGAAKGGSC